MKTILVIYLWSIMILSAIVSAVFAWQAVAQERWDLWIGAAATIVLGSLIAAVIDIVKE